jgi:hypothetical protein
MNYIIYDIYLSISKVSPLLNGEHCTDNKKTLQKAKGNSVRLYQYDSSTIR